jgi:signal transduction histidine kinase/ligand-binding sensor domain-containing protein
LLSKGGAAPGAAFPSALLEQCAPQWRAGRIKIAMRSWVSRRALFAFLTLFLAARLHASNTDAAAAKDSTQFQHSTWSATRGAPADIWAFAQSSDGYLWLGTGEGLYRFDGVRFEVARLSNGQPFPERNIDSLAMLPNGDLWIGYYHDGISLLHDGVLRDFGPSDGVASGPVASLAVAKDGVVWGATGTGLLRWANGKWSTIGEEWGFHDHRASWVFVDPKGTLWVAGADRLAYLSAGSRQFSYTDVELHGDSVINESNEGTLWLSDRLGTRALPGLTADHVGAMRIQGGLPKSADLLVSAQLLFDRQGRMWGSDIAHDLTYLVANPEGLSDGRPLAIRDLTAQFSTKNGMTSGTPSPLLQDIEGTVWVGSNFGLDSLRPVNINAVAGLSDQQRLRYDMVVADGKVWFASGPYVFRLVDHKLKLAATFERTPGLHWFYADGKHIWQSNAGAIVRVDQGARKTIAYPAGYYTDIEQVKTTDGAGGLWISFTTGALFHLVGAVWTQANVQPFPGMTILALERSADGAIWMGYDNGRIARYLPSTSTAMKTWVLPNIGSVNTFNCIGPRTLVGGDSGIAVQIGDQFRSLQALGQQSLIGVTGIVAEHGNVWLNTAKGLIQIADSELLRASNDAGYKPVYRLFDYRDGLPGVAIQSAGPTAGVDARGDIWLQSNQGIAWIDPAHLHVNRVPPRVIISNISTDLRKYTAMSGLELPANTDRLHIEFTATSLAVPERVRFRYRLDEVDADWQDAGDRREAFYTNMKPGRYRFRVLAANDDAIWNSEGAGVTFGIAPAFYQTLWFKFLCALAAILLLALIFALRVRQHGKHVQLRLEARHAERERIARDLHDTLLQSIQALVLRFQMATDSLAINQPSRLLLERALDLADAVIMEGRDRVRGLRSPVRSEVDLGCALRGVGEELAELYRIPFQLDESSLVRPLAPEVAAEVFSIMREAMTNAFRHAQASRIDCRILYTRSSLNLSVVDNGVGIYKALGDPKESQRHFGITGMRERAQSIGAELDIAVRSDGGTSVCLRLAAEQAYVRRRGLFRSASAS